MKSSTRGKTFKNRVKELTHNSVHIQEIEAASHWLKASALTTAPNLLSNLCNSFSIRWVLKVEMIFFFPNQKPRPVTYHHSLATYEKSFIGDQKEVNVTGEHYSTDLIASSAWQLLPKETFQTEIMKSHHCVRCSFIIHLKSISAFGVWTKSCFWHVKRKKVRKRPKLCRFLYLISGILCI